MTALSIFLKGSIVLLSVYFLKKVRNRVSKISNQKLKRILLTEL